MTFTTLTFAVFLVLVFGVYWSTPGRRGQNALLLAASYAFYAWWDYRFCALMLVSSLIDYSIGRGLARSDRDTTRRWLVALSIAANLGMLGFFKYYNFFAENLAALLDAAGVRVDPFTLDLILPVGISFYTFQTLGYTIDVYRRRVTACRSPLDYFTYVSFFPQLVAGPIERAGNLLPQFERQRQFDPAAAADGCRRILWGLFKKMVIADNLAVVVDAVYGDPAGAGGPMLAFATVCFAYQIYCDFSGYSDIAVGTARLFGVRLMQNFAYPYFSRSVGEFWRRWHISLSTWFRDYVYVPLGGSRVAPLRRAANVMITFVTSGLWHGASWNFAIWGGINGACLLPSALRRERGKRRTPAETPGGEGWLPRPRALLSMAITFTIICTAWVFFRASATGDALLVLQRIAAGCTDPAGWIELRNRIAATDGMVRAGLLLVPVLIAVEWVQRRFEHPLHRLPRQRWLRWVLYSALIWAAIGIGTHGNTRFIYFQF